MPTSQLGEFLRAKQSRAERARADWGAKRDEWVAAVNALYRTIVDDYLGDARDVVDARVVPRRATEYAVGSYEVADLVLTVGDEEVVFAPKGVNVIGTAGRIDVRGDGGEATLVRQADGAWAVLLARTPTLQMVPLTPEQFAEVLKRVMRP